MLNRRTLLTQTAGFAVIGLSLGKAAAASLPGIEKASMRGSINATDLGVQPGTLDDQSKAFAKLLRDASERDMPVFLPPGAYVVSNLTLPARVRLSGVPGASRIVYGGDGHLLMTEQAEHIELTGLVFDGANRWMADYAQGLLDLRRVAHLVVNNCRIEYELTGAGPPVVFIHGESHGIEMFQHQLPHFAKTHRCLAYYRRGHGLCRMAFRCHLGGGFRNCLYLGAARADLHRCRHHIVARRHHAPAPVAGITDESR